MSMLLDALKKAALEKKGREAAGNNSASSNGTPDSAINTVKDSVKDNAGGDVGSDAGTGSELKTVSHKELNAASPSHQEAELTQNEESKLIDPVETYRENTLESDATDPCVAEPSNDNKSNNPINVSAEENTNELDLPAPSVDLESFDGDAYSLSDANADIQPTVEDSMDMSSELDFSEIDEMVDLSIDEEQESDKRTADIEVPASETLTEEERMAAEWEAQMLESVSSPADPPALTESADSEVEKVDGHVEAQENDTEPAQSSAMSADDLMAEIVADALAQTEGEAAEVNPQEEEDNKQALANLIESGKRQREKTKRRQMAGVVLLFVLTTVLAGGYYYFLQTDSSSLVTITDYTPADDSDGASDLSEEEVIELEEEGTQVDMQASKSASASELEPTSIKPTAPDKPKQELSAAKAPAPSKPINKPVQVPSDSPKPISTIARSTDVAPLENTQTAPISYHPDRVMRMSLSQKLQAGYQAYNQQNYSSAKTFYSSALRDAPDNRDALLGGAATATRLGRLDIALIHYQHLLALNPQDALAKSGILSLASLNGDLPKLESEVKILLAENAQDAHLHFLLGSLYSSTGNWNGARRSFYRAVELDKFNPDYVYNLAVSFDHSNLYRDALDYYRQAKAISLVASSTFSQEKLDKRIAELERDFN